MKQSLFSIHSQLTAGSAIKFWNAGLQLLLQPTWSVETCQLRWIEIRWRTAHWAAWTLRMAIPAIFSHIQKFPTNSTYFQPIPALSIHFQPFPEISIHQSQFQPLKPVQAICSAFQPYPAMLAISIHFKPLRHFQSLPAFPSYFQPFQPFLAQGQGHFNSSKSSYLLGTLYPRLCTKLSGQARPVCSHTKWQDSERYIRPVTTVSCWCHWLPLHWQWKLHWCS